MNIEKRVFWTKGNILGGFAGRCLVSGWYSLLFNIHLFSIIIWLLKISEYWTTWFGTKWQFWTEIYLCSTISTYKINFQLIAKKYGGKALYYLRTKRNVIVETDSVEGLKSESASKLCNTRLLYKSAVSWPPWFWAP